MIAACEALGGILLSGESIVWTLGSISRMVGSGVGQIHLEASPPAVFRRGT